MLMLGFDFCLTAGQLNMFKYLITASQPFNDSPFGGQHRPFTICFNNSG